MLIDLISQTDTDKVFIHFNDTEKCLDFKKWYTGEIGHTCCRGKGCLLVNIKKNQEMHDIKKQFLEQYKNK